jgi:hypothetical protein
MERARKQVELYKSVRPLLSGDFYPLTPASLHQAWIGYQFHRADQETGFALVFRRPATEVVYPVSDTLTASLRGLDPARKYRVRFERGGRVQVLSGRTLATGVEITLNAPRSVEMIRYESQ